MVLTYQINGAMVNYISNEPNNKAAEEKRIKERHADRKGF